MAGAGLTSGTEFLANAAHDYFRKAYQQSSIARSQSIDKSLNWTPSLSFKIHSHRLILAEVSETPYPLILRIRRADIMNLDMPIAIYCVCPERAYLDDQQSVKELIANGYGLLTVDSQGVVQCRANCTPLIQQIPEGEFYGVIKGLPKTLRIRLAESFERYKSDPPSGAADVAEIMEGLVLKAGREAATKGWISKADAKPGGAATTLGAMQKVAQFKSAAAAIGAVQGYISLYRNPSHHTPRDKKQAAQKYRDCRHGFLDGLRKVPVFRDAMRSAGLTGGLAPL